MPRKQKQSVKTHNNTKNSSSTKSSKRNKNVIKTQQQFYNSEIFKWVSLLALIIVAINIHLEGALSATKQNKKYKQQQSSSKQVEHTINLLDTVINMMSTSHDKKSSNSIKPRGSAANKKNDIFDERLKLYQKPKPKPEFPKFNKNAKPVEKVNNVSKTDWTAEQY